MPSLRPVHPDVHRHRIRNGRWPAGQLSCCLMVGVAALLAMAACRQPTDEDVDSDGPKSHQKPDAQEEQAMAPSPSPDMPAELAAAMQRHDFRWLGRSEQEISAAVAEDGGSLRVIHRDGEDIDHQRDPVLGRVSVRLIGGRALTVYEDREEGPMRLSEGAMELDQLPFIGLSTEDSQQLAKEVGRPWRVRSRDGEQMMLTMDYVPERINAVVVNDVVMAADGG